MWRLLLCSFSVAACAATGTSPVPSRHGSQSQLSASASDLCEHRIPVDVCTRHHPELSAEFKAANDWCVEHGVPESQCYECHRDLSFAPLPALPDGADVARISAKGEDVPTLEVHLARGKVTVFDFYADWCAPCRQIDAHLIEVLRGRNDVAVRKLNVMSWDTPLAKRHLAQVPALPYVVVYGRQGARVAAISGLKLDELDRAIALGAAP
jgi:thiol-disulfide isomerase/thioredoxin